MLTGKSTGLSTEREEVKEVKKSCTLPVLIGSGVTYENVEDYYYLEANALIIGSHFKETGHWTSNVSSEKVDAFMRKIKQLRKCE